MHQPANATFNTCPTSFRFGDLDFLSQTDIVVIDGHLKVFLPYYFLCASSETVISELPVKTLASPFRFSDPDFLSISRRSDDVFAYFSVVQIKICSVSGVFDLMTLNNEHMSHVALITRMIFTKFEVC